ncbi:winged helix-turn-helix transcriptional regulator [Seongchinamella sediminis]|uniref:Winged helix-turn-helix transcriptional regulator n=1 Tax=Seongchinamella sediminis TaxID=2283635 RepID=A0A3L7DZB9_9GAMM|nr:Lrp/AsnC family transcriptional regulator [Seongchinamella sediminis]RLQ21331.1 winged helix-turn-helix transcriptional regulator [Seongchinamella sediminis]
MDSTERTLLRHMQRDAALSVAELAELTGISKSACWRRIQKLEAKGMIRGRVTLLEPATVDLPLTVFISVKTNQHNERWAQHFQQVTENMPGVLEVYRMGGEVDYLIKAVVRDMPGYDALYQQLIKADLFDVSASFVMEALKQTTELPL